MKIGDAFNLKSRLVYHFIVEKVTPGDDRLQAGKLSLTIIIMVIFAVVAELGRKS